MRSVPRRLLVTTTILVCVGVISGVLSGRTLALFSSTTSNAGNSFSAANTFGSDSVAPTVTASTIAKTAGGEAGYIKKNGTYYVYANVSDTGNPASGVSSVTANVATITPGETAAALSSGSFTIDGATYNYRSASLRADNQLAAGTYAYSITATDGVGNTGTQSGLTVVVDNTAPSGSDVQTTNKAGGIVGRAEQGDSITFTFTETMDPNSILAGWSGASTNVVVRLDNNGLLFSNDKVFIYNSSNSTELSLGIIDLNRDDYTSGDRTFGATGTPSTMVQSGSSITITLGTASGSTTTAAGSATMSWDPSSSATDWAGNGCSITTKSESGAADREF